MPGDDRGMFATSLLRTIAAQDVLIAAGDGAVAMIGKSCSIFIFALFKSLLINSIFNLKNLFLNNILNTATTVNKLFKMRSMVKAYYFAFYI